ncbi:hypothetical protein XPA_009492 [Xanthoria parietina]
MTEVSQYASRTPTFSLPTTPSSPTRPGSPAKGSSVIGDSNSFLTALAAQERRVLELKEELQKAEADLSRLKKQWATHEAIKKRNEFRHREQLQKLGPTSHSYYEECRARNPSSATFDSYDGRPAETERGEQGQTEGEQRAKHLNITPQTQRRVFEGSRHTRALSLLSKAGTTRNASSLVLQKPGSHAPHPSQKGTLLERSHTLSTRQPPHCISARETPNVQPREVFIETSKQLVGDLREGLWTLFEDLRQATVGEEVSSDPHRVLKAKSKAVYDPSSPGVRREVYNTTPESLSGNGSDSRNISSKNRIISPSIQQRPIIQPVRRDKRDAESNNSIPGLIKQAVSSDDEDPWDTWDSPAVPHLLPCGHTESITTDSPASPSPSTRRESPRSSLSSLNATSTASQADVSIEKAREIPWPALTKLSPGNLKMTASNLMNEYPSKTQRAE